MYRARGRSLAALKDAYYCVFKTAATSLPRAFYCQESQSSSLVRQVRDIVQGHMPAHGLDLPLQDVSTKSKILLECERTFNRAIPDNQLGSITTVNDIIKFYERPQLNSNPYSVFPRVDKMRSEGQIPPNLSFPEVTNLSRLDSNPNRTRVPFQNYDSADHASFLTKKEKEARKKKRRHLTAWK